MTNRQDEGCVMVILNDTGGSVKAGDPIAMSCAMGDLVGRYAGSDGQGALMRTPHGSLFRSGLAWVRAATAADLEALKAHDAEALVMNGFIAGLDDGWHTPLVPPPLPEAP